MTDSLFSFAPRVTTALHNHGGLDYGRLRFDRIIGRWRCVKCGRFA